MSLTTRVALWLAGLWLAAVGLVLALGVWAAADALRAQWADLNRQAAVEVASALGRVPPEGEARSLAAAARFERGDLLWLSLRRGEAATLFERRRLAAEGTDPLRAAWPAAPAWFQELLPAPAPAAAAPLRDDAAADTATSATLGTPATPAAPGTEVAVVADGAQLQRLAWRAWLRFAAVTVGASLVLVLVAGFFWRRWHRLLRGTVAQAQSLERLQFVEVPEPRWPELRELTRAMNAVVRRLRERVVAQAEQVAQLQRQVQTDTVTGLPLRAYFLSRLGDVLGDARLPAASLLLVRVPDLVAMNERHGRDVTDRLLVAVADVLLTYVERIGGAAAGRLTGQDFALALPAAGAARETAAAIEAAVAASPASRLPGVRVVVAGCDGLRGLAAGAALSAADAALARAEAAGETVVEDLSELGATGARAWRELIAAALDESRVRLGAFPVVDAEGRLIHLECPLRVQVEPGGEFLVARRWLAIAARSRLTPLVDLSAVNLALAAIAVDGQPRCMHVAPRSLLSPGFPRALLARLKTAGPAAARLSMEWAELPDGDISAALREAVPAWRKLGVRVGVEHAGASPRTLPALKEVGIDYVKIDARHLHGVQDDDASRSYVESLVGLVHGLGLQALAEGVADPRQLEALWAIGFDGATGAAVGMADDEPKSGRVEEGEGAAEG
ncbi:MAG: GGDEF domain-containing protein [Burkholderiaceae bacterium]|nr:GGDEF domain-containing protein [Burkholderiaceae bacterium]